MEPVRLPIDGTLDLHTFKPGEVPELRAEKKCPCGLL
jgi:hypothetical protein